MKNITLIIPCYNESEVLDLLYAELVKVTEQMKDGYEFKFLFVNDGSKDDTLSKLKELSKRDERVTYISFSRNFGKEAAMYAGFCNADGDYVAVMDADMQDPPSLLPHMVEYLESGEYDSVATRRVSRADEPKIRSFFARQFYKIINKMSNVDIVDGARDFRLMRREMVDVIVEMGEQNRFSKGLFGWIGFRTKWLPHENVERAAGETKWSFWGLFRYAIGGIVSFSEGLLRAASIMGVVFTIVAFVFIIFVVVRRAAFGDPVSGWASLVCIVTFIGGVQLLCIGIIGEYLSRTYIETKKRPHYIVGDTNDSNVKKIG